MFEKSLNNRFVVFVMVVLVMSLCISGMLQAAGGTPFSAKEKRELLPKTPAELSTAVTEMLKEIAKTVNTGGELTEDFLETNKIKIKGAKPHLKQLKKEQLCDYYMVTAWINYFSDDTKRAYLAAQMALKNNPQNLDARITNATMAMLMDKEPTRIPSRSRSKTPTATSTKSSLEFDVESIRQDLIGQQIPAAEVKCLNSTTMNYQPDQATLCVLFWCILDKDGKPNFADPIIKVMVDPNEPAVDPNKVPMSESHPPMDDFMMDPMMMYDGRHQGMQGNYSAAKSRSFTADIKAFSQLYTRSYGNSEFQFLSVNTDKAEQLQSVLENLMQTPQPWAVTMAKLPSRSLQQFAEIEVERPVMAIIDKTGTIKYAGSPQGFLPEMILNKVSGVALSQAIAPATKSDGQQQTTLAQAMDILKKAQAATPAKTQKAVPVKTSYKELAPEEDFDAQKRLGAARDLFLPAAGKRFLTPKRGIELCRGIIKDYPNSKYAEESRKLLREEINPRYRERYKLTDEELGL